MASEKAKYLIEDIKIIWDNPDDYMDEFYIDSVTDKILAYIGELEERAEKAEAMVERMIEAGAPLVAFAGMMNYKDAIQILTAHINNWNALVAEWKERE